MPDHASPDQAPPAPQNHPLAVLQAEASRLGMALTRAHLARFGRYLEMLIEWAPRAGLTSLRDPAAIQSRHFAESLALLRVLREAAVPDSAAWSGGGLSMVDVGAGAGLPGLPVAVVEDGVRLTLVESSARRCRFLEAAVKALDLSSRVRVVRARAEEAGRDPALRGAFDLAVARAVAPMPVLVEYALPLLRLGGVLAAPKGSRAAEELAAAAGAIATLGGEAEPPLALPLPDGAPPQQVLIVRRTGPLDERYPRRAGVPARRPLS